MILEIYTDGSGTSAGNPAGWAYVIVANGKALAEKSGRIEAGTNNDAELEAALQGLEDLDTRLTMAVRPDSVELVLVSDSQLVLGWASGRFRCKQDAKRQKVERLWKLYKKLGCTQRWVRGHSGNPYNERCDVLAGAARLGEEPKDKRRLTRIGGKKDGVVMLKRGTAVKLVDLEANRVEDYNPSLHGDRSGDDCITV